MSQKTRALRATGRSSSFSSKMNKTSVDHEEPESKSIRSETRKMGPMCKTRKKAADFTELVGQEEIDLDEQITKERCFDDDTDCMWLSSDSSSSSSFFEEYRMSTSLHLSVDDWLIAWLSTLANSYVHLDKASSISDKARVNPEDTCSTPGSGVTDSGMILQEDLEDEVQLSLIPKSSRNCAVDSSVGSSDGSRLSLELCPGNSTSCASDNSPMPCSPVFDSPLTSEWDRMSYSVSLLNLDSEDSKWITDTDMESDCLQSNFPSPSCSRNWSSDVSSPSSIVSTRGKLKDEYLPSEISLDKFCTEAEDFDADEPLFWPFDKKVDWDSEGTWKCFSMSPRKDTARHATPQEISSKSVGVKFHGSKVDSRGGCRRRLVFSSGSTASKILELKKRRNDDTSRTKNINFIPSRLKNSIKDSVTTIVPKEDDHIKENKDGKACIPAVDTEDRKLLQEDFASNEELPIETLLGLGEFDGHEGVDSEFNEDLFSLDDSF